jgi:prepilin-type N-terminal cleavage/methylation domain-containing protein
MHKGKALYKQAFTLIEVMVSVVIISTVIMALLEMYANNTHIFSNLNKKTNINQHATLFISNDDFGLEKKDTYLYDLVEEFKVEDKLRKELKTQKINILYQPLDTIDLAEFDEEENDALLNPEEKEISSNMIFEIGKTILKTKDASIGYLRLQLHE